MAAASTSLVFETKALASALKTVLAAVERRNTIPILANVMIEAKADGVVSLVGTDLDVIVRRAVRATSVAGAASFTIAAHRLGDVLATFDEGSQTAIEIEGRAAIVKSGRAKVRFATLPSDDFPKVVQKEVQASFAIDPAALVRGFDTVRHAWSTEETRYYLNGILWHAKDDRLRFVTTDGHRLARYIDVLPDGAKGMPDTILARKFVEIVRSAIDGVDGPIDVKIGDGKVAMSHGDFSILAKVIDGTYPDYERVIPSGIKFEAVVDRDSLDAGLSRVGAATNDKVRVVKIDLSRTSLRASVSSAEHGDANDELPCEFSGDELSIGFNLRYFRDALAALPVDTLKIGLIDAAAPTLITSIASDEVTLVLMPMRV